MGDTILHDIYVFIPQSKDYGQTEQVCSVATGVRGPLTATTDQQLDGLNFLLMTRSHRFAGDRHCSSYNHEGVIAS